MAQYNFKSQTSYYKGKVRDVYTIHENLLVLIASDRISAFDVILPEPIPYKGQVLNQIAAFMLKATENICPNWLLETPAPNVSIGKKCDPLKVEMVVRGNCTGHAWRTYAEGKRTLCGVQMPNGLKENDFFPEPIITPTTKASQGHDEDISKQEIISSGIVDIKDYDHLEVLCHKLFKKGSEIANDRGLILADTKYEFGKIGDIIYLMDEIHTPDSSRYFYQEGFVERQKNGKKQKQLSKEFVREWLIQNNFMGKKGQEIPHMSQDWINMVSKRYIELYEKLIGESFKPENFSEQELLNRIELCIDRIENK